MDTIHANDNKMQIDKMFLYIICISYYAYNAYNVSKLYDDTVLAYVYSCNICWETVCESPLLLISNLYVHLYK